MPEFKEFNSDSFNDKKDGDGKKKKKLKIKNPWFIAGLVLVVVLVIYNKMKERQNTDSYSIVPTGYSGYPETVGGSSVSDTSYYDDALSTMADEMNTALDAIYKENETNTKNLINEWNSQNKAYESTIDSLSQQIDTFDQKYESVMEVVDQQSAMLEYQNIITQMQSNSDKALITNSQSEKDYLHNVNTQLAESIGAKFNDNDGYWYVDGQRLYSTALQSSKAQSVNTSIGSTSKPSTSIYDSVIAQMEANSKAYKTATDSQKNELYKQNQELGKSIGLSYDDASGKWKTSTGADAWNYNQPAYTGGGGSSSSSNQTYKASSSSGTKSTTSSSTTKTTASSGSTNKTGYMSTAGGQALSALRKKQKSTK